MPSDSNTTRFSVVIEIPRGGFAKRGWSGNVDFISPFPCPFNYGAIPDYIGCEGDLLDAVVLGPRLPRGTVVDVRSHGAIGFTDRGMYDDKLICSQKDLTPQNRRLVLAFFHLYAVCKRLLNLYRGRPGETYCNGWTSTERAVSRATPSNLSDWQGSPVPF